jgi:ferric iron reductase protein FhuF
VDAVGVWAGTRERRVAASLVVLGYSARLVGPTLATVLRDGILLDVRPHRVRYRYRPDTGFQLSLPDPGGWHGPREPLLRGWCEVVVDGHLGGLIQAVRAVVPAAAGMLWGNVASGLAGALRALAQTGHVPAHTCLGAGLSLLDHGPLRGAGDLRIHDGQLRFRRRSCCLFYRLDGGGMCGDCALLPR